jgi:transposase-like protein
VFALGVAIVFTTNHWVLQLLPDRHFNRLHARVSNWVQQRDSTLAPPRWRWRGRKQTVGREHAASWARVVRAMLDQHFDPVTSQHASSWNIAETPESRAARRVAIRVEHVLGVTSRIGEPVAVSLGSKRERMAAHEFFSKAIRGPGVQQLCER